MVEHLGVVEEAVEDRGGERFVAEGVGPFADGLVARDDRRAAGVAAVDDLKDAVGVGAIEWQVAGFVAGSAGAGAAAARACAASLPSASACAEAADEVVQGGVADEVAAGEGFHPQPDRDVAFADARWPQDQAADLALDEAQRPQLGEALGDQGRAGRLMSKSSRVLWCGSPAIFSRAW